MPVLSTFDYGMFRSPGPGLGNLLFPLARAISAQEMHGGLLVYPTFRQMKFGTIVRRERDLRTYGDVFRPRTANDWIHWLKVKRLPKVDEYDYTSGQEDVAVTYKGLRQYFHGLQDNQELIYKWILSNSLQRGLISREYDIAIHVRLGDFSSSDKPGSGYSIRQSIEWYKDAYNQAMSILGTKKAEAMLFTDEDPLSVAKALAIPGLQIDPSQNAVTALLNMARARLVVTSRSSFSMWSVFLGGSHALWDSRFDVAKSFPLRSNYDHIL